MCTYKMVYLLTFSYILYRKTNILNFLSLARLLSEFA